MSVAVIGRPEVEPVLNRISVFSFDPSSNNNNSGSDGDDISSSTSSSAPVSPETIESLPNNASVAGPSSAPGPATAGPSSSVPSSRLLTLRNNIRSLRPFCTSEPPTRQNSVESSASSASGSDSWAPCSLGTWNCFEPGALTAGLYSACSSPSRSVPSSPCCGPKFKLIQEGDIHVCRLNHTRTIISKILSSKFLRRWETHHLYLEDRDIRSKSPSGFVEDPIPYSQLEDVYAVNRWVANHKFCIRIVIQDGSLLLQVNNVYLRDQWLHSILWKRSILRYRKLLMNTRRPEVLIKELGSLVEMSLITPLQDEVILQTPLEIISDLLVVGQHWIPKVLNEEIITVISPLLERTTPSAEICDFFCKHCQDNPRSSLIFDNFTSIVERILKHNMDFGKYPKTRVFVQDYIQALNCQNDGYNVVRNFVASMHGPASTCPHPRVLHNMVSVCLAAIHSIFEERRNFIREEVNISDSSTSDWEMRHDCFINILEAMVSFEDWRSSLSQLLQPIPFPDDAIACERFTSKMKGVIKHIVSDYRCDVHLMVLGIRDEKEGWFQLYCPGAIACDDEGELWSLILKQLLACCCRRKRFLVCLTKYLLPCMLRALRDDEVCQDALCNILELDVVENNDMQLQIITTLQSTATGKVHYAALCSRQRHLRELQQKGGPRKLTLPSRSTDADVAKLLSCGSFGNLECLYLAFTQITSASAEQLIKIPSLRYLNLWSTQFGDVGLQIISEHLPKLEVLNLCETPVTDKGLSSLAALKNLRKLNLNSTSLSAQTFESLKKKLPSLQECDIRYTDAW